MKNLILLSALLFSVNSYALYHLDLEINRNEKGLSEEFKLNLEAAIDEEITYEIPDSNKVLKVTMSDRIPEVLTPANGAKDHVYISLKILEKRGKKTEIIATPKIVSLLGNEGLFETYEDKDAKKPSLSVKLTPRLK